MQEAYQYLSIHIPGLLVIISKQGRAQKSPELYLHLIPRLSEGERETEGLWYVENPPSSWPYLYPTTLNTRVEQVFKVTCLEPVSFTT